MIGVDVIELSRMREILDRSSVTFLKRVFSPAERARALAGDPVRFFASAFAAKEAVFKAFGVEDWPDGFDLTEIEIGRDAAGRPNARLSAGAAATELGRSIERITVSISYETDLAIAVAFIQPKCAADAA